MNTVFIRIFILLISLLLSFKASSQIVHFNSDSLISYSKSFLGVKYKYGQSNPKIGFDCSGFVQYVFNHFKIQVPRASMDYEKAGRIVPIDSTKSGDIIVFTGTNSKIRKPGHVGIVVSNIGGQILFIHSSSGQKSNGVIITNFSLSDNYKKRLIKIARLGNVVW